ncbi:MAG: sigma-70 family RNA polymerase sigma factor [Phycisphaerales bacterium]|nr:sigma-70 family RNA polymerase sigma factor [Phycisphaerales bacterium]
MIVSLDTLTTRALSGDRDALEEVLDKYDERVRRRLAGRIGAAYRSAFDLDDVMQVTYLEVFLKIEQFIPSGPDSFFEWVSAIGENNIRDAVRELNRAKRPPRGRQVSLPHADDSFVVLLELLGGTSSTPDRRAARGEAKTLLEAAIARLPEDYRNAVTLMDLNGMAAEDAAGTMGRSKGAMHMLRARAHERLALLMGSRSNYLSSSS